MGCPRVLLRRGLFVRRYKSSLGSVDLLQGTSLPKASPNFLGFRSCLVGSSCRAAPSACWADSCVLHAACRSACGHTYLLGQRESQEARYTGAWRVH